MSSWPIDKRYDGGTHVAEAAHALAYAAATGDSSPACRGADAICPPMFHVRLMKELLFAIMEDPELDLDMLRLVHGEHDARFHQAIRPGDAVALHARLLDVTEKPSGLLVTGGLYAHVDGTLAVECRTVFFVRAPKKPESRGARPPPEAPPPPDFTASVDVRADQSTRYAEASLDNNPIHVDPDTARAAGLPDVILQGLCTMALTGNAFLRAAADDDARRLARLSVRFSRPVRNGTQLTVRGWADGPSTWALETLDGQGRAVITGARAQLR